MNFDQMKHSGIKVFRIHNPRATSVIAPEFRTMLVDEIHNNPAKYLLSIFQKLIISIPLLSAHLLQLIKKLRKTM
jgi:hypothetical protein